MLDQTVDDKVVELRRMAAEYFQKAAWYQILSLDNYRERNFEARSEEHTSELQSH